MNLSSEIIYAIHHKHMDTVTVYYQSSVETHMHTQFCKPSNIHKSPAKLQLH